MGNSSIEWTNKTWTPLRARVKHNAGAIAKAKGYTSLVQIATKMAGRVGPHCERVSDGCEHCYSELNNGRCLTHNGTGLPFDRRSRDLVEPFLDDKILQQPLHWKKPSTVFVCSQTDLFGEWVTDEQLDRIFAVMSMCPQHTFQVLTKRPERMLRYLTKSDCIFVWQHQPLPNVWLGVSVEDQVTANERILPLLQTPAGRRFVSYEPALGPVDFQPFLHGLDWIIVGGESGPGARLFELQWARNTIAQCQAAGVACFVKQLGKHPLANRIETGVEECHAVPVYFGFKHSKGGDMEEWPEDLHVREFPKISVVEASA